MLGGMRLCECFDFFFFNELQDFSQERQTCMTVHVIINPWWGWSICFKCGTYKHLSDEKLWEEGGRGRGGRGWDTASGTMD